MKLFRPIRSKLFVPGSRPELFPKAFGSETDAVSFDLEDSVVESKKDQARSEVASFLREPAVTGGKVTIVRVNGLSGTHFLADVAALKGSSVDVINLPKVESRDDVQRAVEAISALDSPSTGRAPIGILANIETPKGLRLALEIATADPRVMGLQLGFTDFSLACGIHSRNLIALNAVRLAIIFAAAEAGVASYDGAFVDTADREGFRLEAEAAKALGFAGKSCIHPSQIAMSNVAFSPTPDEVGRAQRLLAAADEAEKRGTGAFLHEGKMVDSPIIARAREVLALAARCNEYPKS